MLGEVEEKLKFHEKKAAAHSEVDLAAAQGPTLWLLATISDPEKRLISVVMSQTHSCDAGTSDDASRSWLQVANTDKLASSSRHHLTLRHPTHRNTTRS